jgi:hypothetical protein
LDTLNTLKKVYALTTEYIGPGKSGNERTTGYNGATCIISLVENQLKGKANDTVKKSYHMQPFMKAFTSS